MEGEMERKKKKQLNANRWMTIKNRLSERRKKQLPMDIFAAGYIILFCIHVVSHAVGQIQRLKPGQSHLKMVT